MARQYRFWNLIFPPNRDMAEEVQLAVPDAKGTDDSGETAGEKAGQELE